MSKVAICTSLYEAGRPYLDAYLQGVRSVSKVHDITFVAAIHGLDAPEKSLAPVEDVAEVRIVHVSLDAGIPEVRQQMILAGIQCDVECLMLTDMDDYLLPASASAHLAALTDADFSYGDMKLIDADGKVQGRTFFQDVEVPDRLLPGSEATMIMRRNFLGFSNTAIRKHCVDPAWLKIPDGLVSVDWWFFTKLMQRGYRGAKASGTVTCYRTYDGNILGGLPDPTLSAVRRRVDINRRHCAMFAKDPAFAARCLELDALERWLGQENDETLAEIEKACAQPSVWFDDIARLTDRVCSN